MRALGRTACVALALSWAAIAAPAPLGAGGVGPSVTPGFPNVPRTPGQLLSPLMAPGQGRTAILAIHNGVLFSVPEVPSSQPGSDYQVRTWSLADPSSPAQLATHGVTPMPINAHGYFQSGPYLILGSNWPPESPWTWRAEAAPSTLTRTAFPDPFCAGVRGCLFAPWYVGGTFWSYSEVTGNASLWRNNVELGNWDHLGQTGVIGHPFLLGDLLIFAADQSRTGVATYDVSDPSNPVLLDVLTAGGPGGYWPELWGGNGKLYAVFPYRDNGNGLRVVDLTDPTDLKLVADTPLDGAEAMYLQFQDEYGFTGDHKVDMRTFQSVLDLNGATVPRPGGGTGVDTSQFALPLGNLLVTGGVGPNQGMAVWAHQAEPDTRGPSVGFHIPQAGRTNYPVGAPISLLIHETLETFTIVNGETFLVRPVGGSAIAGRLTFAFDDVLTFTPTAPLAANTTYEVVLPEGGIKDAAGNGIEGYSFTFSTGGAIVGNDPPVVTDLASSEHPGTPGEPLELTATASDPEGQPLEYRFDFGDGAPKSAWSSDPSIEHSFAGEGHFRITVQVRDADGALASRSRTVAILDAAIAAQPPASSAVACAVADRRVWVANPDHGTVSAVDADTLAVELEVPVCSAPRSVARASTGELWVACSGDDRLRILDGASGFPIAEVATGYGSAPMAVATSPSGGTVYASFDGAGVLRRYDAASRSSTGERALGRGARAIAVTPDGARIFVTRFLSPRDHAEIWEVNATTFALTRTLRVNKFGNDANRDTTASGRGTPNQLAAALVSPDGSTLWVGAQKPNVGRGLLFGPDLDSDNTVRAVLLGIDLGTNQLAHAIDLDNSDSPSALAFSPAGDFLFVALQGNDEIAVLDRFLVESAAGLGAQVARFGAGPAPQGLCSDAATSRLFVQNFLGRDVSAIEALPFLESGDITVASSEIDVTSGEPLAPGVLAGKQIFYRSHDPRMSAEGYLSCATCHLDGASDGRVWDFTGRGEGQRRTPLLRGKGGTDQGNVHWSANFDEIQDFEHDARNAFGGTGFLSEQDFAATSDPLGAPKAGLSPELDQLAAYVGSLGVESIPRSPFRNADGTMSAAATAGRTVFRSLDCSSCHAGPGFTDSTLGAETLHDVGTLRTTSGGRLGGPLPGIDTPTLLGLHAAGAYLHDGSAPTLDDVFRVAGGFVVSAESGTPSGGAGIQTQYVDLNNDDTLHGRGYAGLANTNAQLRFSNVDGGSGGTGAVELRFSTAAATAVELRVNGVAHAANLPAAGNSPTWRHTNWLAHRFENVALNAGASNTIDVVATGAFPNLSLDEIVVSTADDLAVALPHRQVLALAESDRANLLAFLRQLDATPEENPGQAIFVDGFDVDGTEPWSETQQ